MAPSNAHLSALCTRSRVRARLRHAAAERARRQRVRARSAQLALMLVAISGGVAVAQSTEVGDEGGGAAGPAALVPVEGSAPAPARSATAATLERIAECESGGDPRAIGGGGLHRGKYQFTFETWRDLGGVGDPAAAPEAEQDRRAAQLLRERGTAPWPNCP